MEKSDSRILRDVLFDYALAVPYTRMLLFPTLAVMVIAKFLEVKVADLYKDISRAIKEGKGQSDVLWAYAIIYATSVVLGELQSFIICRAGQEGYRLANKNTYSYFMKLPPTRLRKYGRGEIVNTVARKSQAVQDIIDVFTLNFFPTFLTLLFISITVIRHIGVLPMAIINCAILLYAVSTIKITRGRNTMRANINRASNTSSNIQMDGLINHETAYIYNCQDYEVQRYDHALKDLETHSTQLEQSKYCLNLAQKSVWCALSVSVISLATLGILAQKITTDQLALFISLIAILIRSLDNFGFMYGKYQAALVNIKAAGAVEHTAARTSVCTIEEFRDRITVAGLQLRSKDRLLMDNISFEIVKGQKVAIIGRNGVGKSSLLKAILKLRETTAGEISLDGMSIHDISDQCFREIVSYIPQEPHLFNETVMYNIKYGSPKTYDDEVIRLSKDLELHSSIVGLEGGYSTHVGDQGSSLSGGERQKIIVLRALLRKAPILIMDEPTAALDKSAEEKVLRKIMDYEELTVITIVHNLEILDLFDRILCVESTGVREIHNISELNIGSWAITA